MPEQEGDVRAEKLRAGMMREYGVPGLDWTSGMILVEPERELQGQQGIKQYDQMRRSDPTVRAVLLAMELPIRQAQWRINPASDASPDVEAAEFVESTLHDQSSGFDDILSEACTMFAFGWAWMEWVLKRRLGRSPGRNRPSSQYDDGLVGFRKISLRSQASWTQWDLDNNGNVQGMYQRAPMSGTDLYIPLEKSLLFRTTREANNPEGFACLRPAHRPWKFKYNIERIEAVGLQRALMGVPVVGYETSMSMISQTGDQSDEHRARELIASLYDNRSLGVIKQPGMTFEFATPDMQGITGDSSRVIQRYDEAIARSALAQYIMLGSRERGSYALAKELGDLFFLAVEGLLGTMAQVFTRWGIPVLFSYNYFPNITGYPEVSPALNRRVDIAALADFINKVVGQRVIVPDEVLEQHIRALADLPPKAIEIGEGREPVTPAPEETSEEQVSAPDTEPDEASQAVETFAQPSSKQASRYHRATDAYEMELANTFDSWVKDTAAGLGAVPAEQGVEGADNRLKAALAGLLLLLKRRSWERFPEAMALGYGSAALPPRMRHVVEAEIDDNERWLKTKLIPAIGKELPMEELAQAMILAWGGNMDTFEEEIGRALGRRRGHVRQYAGHYWRVIWLGALERLREEEDGYLLPVRWVPDPLAKHCPTCLLFGYQEYANMEALLAATGGILPGIATECDGHCRCHLEVQRMGLWHTL